MNYPNNASNISLANKKRPPLRSQELGRKAGPGGVVGTSGLGCP
jgi:hypothetical protein